MNLFDNIISVSDRTAPGWLADTTALSTENAVQDAGGTAHHVDVMEIRKAVNTPFNQIEIFALHAACLRENLAQVGGNDWNANFRDAAADAAVLYTNIAHAIFLFLFLTKWWNSCFLKFIIFLQKILCILCKKLRRAQKRTDRYYRRTKPTQPDSRPMKKPAMTSRGKCTPPSTRMTASHTVMSKPTAPRQGTVYKKAQEITAEENTCRLGNEWPRVFL